LLVNLFTFFYMKDVFNLSDLDLLVGKLCFYGIYQTGNQCIVLWCQISQQKMDMALLF
jgi:hypothetical protein